MCACRTGESDCPRSPENPAKAHRRYEGWGSWVNWVVAVAEGFNVSVHAGMRQISYCTDLWSNLSGERRNIGMASSRTHSVGRNAHNIHRSVPSKGMPKKIFLQRHTNPDELENCRPEIAPHSTAQPWSSGIKKERGILQIVQEAIYVKLRLNGPSSMPLKEKFPDCSVYYLRQ